MSIAEPRTALGHDVWQSRVDEVLKGYRSSDKTSEMRDAALRKLHELGVPDWAAVKWIDGKTA